MLKIRIKLNLYRISKLYKYSIPLLAKTVNDSTTYKSLN